VADLGCLAPAPGGGVAEHPHGPKRSRALRKGDRGPVVVRLTHRLSALRSKQTRTAYLDGARSRFDAETEAALKSFQAEHGLAASGRYGRETARALLKAIRRAKAQAEHVATAGTEEAKPDAGTTSLPALVREYQRHDALADQAWQKIEAYGRQRMRVLGRLERREADTDIGKLTARLAGIEAQLALLVELERQELEVERRELELEHHELVLELAELEPGPEGLAAATTPAAYPPVVQAEEAVALAPTVTGAGGSNGAGAIVDKPPRTLSDLSDAELDKHIDLLDSRLERSRKLRVARYARVEKAIARATGKPLVVVRPPADGKKPERPHHGKPTKPPAGEDRKPAHHPARPSGVKALQRALNSFTEKYLDGVPPLEVDGKKGPETDKRIRTVKFYLGYGGAARRSTAVPAPFLRRLQHPRSVRHSGPAMLARANSRRRKQRAQAKRLASGVIEGTPKHIIDQIVLPIAQQSGVHRTPAENDAANARHGPTNTGGRSDHQGPPTVAWAADMSNGSSPTPQMDALARSLAKRFDIPWSGAGLVNATHGGYRYQLIYRTNLGGNHFNHVHFGVRDV
jgi:peptidoglycan hydrolase-like protein with peptidoglycan-binding domain